jgi:hypothetical protein
VFVSVVFGGTGEPPDADPHVRWCGRGRSNTAPYPICESRGWHCRFAGGRSVARCAEWSR